MTSDVQKMMALMEVLVKSDQMRRTLQQASYKLSPEAGVEAPEAFMEGLEEMALIYEGLAADIRHIAESLKIPA